MALLGITLPPPLAATLVFALILAALLSNLIQHDTRCGSEVEAFNHSEHWNAYTHFAAIDGEIADTSGFVTEPDR